MLPREKSNAMSQSICSQKSFQVWYSLTSFWSIKQRQRIGSNFKEHPKDHPNRPRNTPTNDLKLQATEWINDYKSDLHGNEQYLSSDENNA